jgi:hypothetical protein
MFMEPVRTRYTKNGDISVAYLVFGESDVDLSSFLINKAPGSLIGLARFQAWMNGWMMFAL